MMASDGETPCLNDANFAVICSFLKVFGKLYGIEVPTISKLEEFIENTQEVLEPLKDLHVRLLRRALKSVPSDKWEKCLIKFCHQQGCHQEAWELERFSYKKSSIQVKLKVLKILLEYQFTCNIKFKNSVNAIPCKELRLEPIGKDKTGCAYWLHMDDDANLCLYKEDLDEETWQLVARNREELVAVIDKLKKGEVVGESIQDTSNINEDSNSVDIPDNKVDNSDKLLEADVNSDEEENSIKKLKLSENGDKIKNNLIEDNVNEDSTNKSNNINNETIDVSNKLVESKVTSCSELKSDTEVEDKVENKLEINIESDGTDINISSQETISDTKAQGKPENDLTVDNLEDKTQSIDKSDNKADISTDKTENEPKINVSETDIKNNDTPDATSNTKVDQIEEDDKGENKTSKDNSETKSSDLSEVETKPNNPNDTEKANNIETVTSELSLDKKKALESTTIENSEVSETIEEAVMVITGEGNGADCESGYYLGEEICEPVMYFWGEGSGYDNDTGNTEIVEKSPEPPKKAKHVDQTNGEVINETKTPITSIKLRSSQSSVVRRPLKKSGDASEPVKIDPKKHCVRDIDNSKKDDANKTEKSFESDNVSGSNDNETQTKQIKKANKKDKNASVLPRKVTLRHKAKLSNSISETENGNDQKTTTEKRKSSVSSNENEETENHKENNIISQCSESPKEVLPPKKLKLESSADESEQSKMLACDNKTEYNKSGEDEAQIPVHKRKKIKAKKGKFKRKNIQKNLSPPSDEKEKQDVSKNDSENVKTSKKSLKRTLLETCQSEQKSESQSEREEDEPVTKGKRLKVKPKKITLSTRKKVEESKLKQKSSSEESEEETLYSLAGKKSAKKPTKKKVKSCTKANVEKIQEEKPHSDDDITPVRQSRRIAQLKIKEEADRRHMEEVALRELKKQHKKKTKSADDEEEEWKQSGKSSDSESGGVTKRRRAHKAHKGWRADSSSPPHSDTEDEEPIEHEEPDLVFNKSDHEFSPESDLEGDEPSEPLKMARTLQEDADDGFCVVCGSDEQPEWILLCDHCDRGYHAACLKPVLFLVPTGDWHCPPCQHAMLIDALESELTKYDELLKVVKVEREKRRQEEDEKKIETAEQDDKEGKEEDEESGSGSWSSSSSCGAVYRLRERRQLPVSYRAREYDRLISTAIKEEYVEPVSTAGNQGRGKDISTIIEAAEEEKLKAEKEALEQGIPVELRKNKKKNRRKPRKLNSLDVPSEDDDETDEDFKETGLETSSEEISSEAEQIGYSDSRSSDSLPISRSCRISRKDRPKLIESSPEIKKKKGVFTDSDSESSDTKEWKSKKKSRTKSGPGGHKRRRNRGHGPRSPRTHRGLQQYDAEGNVVRARVTYGGLTSDNDWSPKHRTRQKKINYTETPNTESEGEMHKSSGKHMPDSSDEFKITESDASTDSENERRKKQESDAEEKRKAICDLIKKTAVVPLEKLPEDVTKAKTEELEAHLSAKCAETSRAARGRGSRGGKSRGGRGGRGASKSDDPFSRLVGLKIKDLSQKPDEQTMAMQLEKEKRRQEKEAKLAEKEARKQERLQKREEKKKLQEQKAKEREEKRNAKLAMQETKRVKKEKPDYPMAIPIQGFGMAGQDGIPRPAPRLQVRPELRAMEPDPARAHLSTHPHMHRPRGEGTLSVAGSPQPFKPVSEEPSVITRMPHMVNQQYRGNIMYGGGGYGYGRFPPGAPYYPPAPTHHLLPHLQRTGNGLHSRPGPPHQPSPGPPHHPPPRITHHPSSGPPHHPSSGPPHHPSSVPPHHPSSGPPHHPSSGSPHHPSSGPPHHPSSVPPHHPSSGPPHHPSSGPPYHSSSVPSHHPSSGPPQHPSSGPPHHPSARPHHHPSPGPPHHSSPGPHNSSPGPHHPSPGPPHHPSPGPPHHPSSGHPHHPSLGQPHHPSSRPHHPSPGPPHHPSPPIPHHISQGLLHHPAQRLHHPSPGPSQHPTHGPPHHPGQTPPHHLPQGPVHHPFTGGPLHTLPPHLPPPRHMSVAPPRFPAYYAPEPVLVKTEVKCEPTPSPPAGSPPPAPPPHRLMKVTDSKARKPRFPLGPYAPQYYPPANPDPREHKREVTSVTNAEPISYDSQIGNKPVPVSYANENPNKAEAISYASEASNKEKAVSYATEVSNKAEPISYANEVPNKAEAISYVSDVSNKTEHVSYASAVSNKVEPVSYANDGSNKAGPVSYASDVPNKAEPVSYASDVSNKAEPVSYASEMVSKVKTEPEEEPREEGSSVFGGLVSYFSSQHEDDIDA